MEMVALTGGELLGFVFGVALGLYVGVMIAPIARWWIARREWLEASRTLEDEAFDRLVGDDREGETVARGTDRRAESA